MPGTRTAPAIAAGAGNATRFDLSVTFVDALGQVRTVTLAKGIGWDLDAANTLVDEWQALTNASIFKVSFTTIFEGPRIAGNALSQESESVFDNVAVNYKDVPARRQQTVYVPAPIPDLVVAGPEVVTTLTEYEVWRDDLETQLGGNFEAIAVRFTERRQKNDSKPA